MKNFAIFIYISCCLLTLFKVNEPNAHIPSYQVEIYQGLKKYGTYGIIYNHEGLLIRKDSSLFGGRSFLFLSKDELDIEKVISLNKFLNSSKGLMDLPDTILEAQGIYPFNYPNRIIIRELDGNYFKKILDYNYTMIRRPKNEKPICELFEKINNLIPSNNSFLRFTDTCVN
jgi:hypothetical protein